MSTVDATGIFYFVNVDDILLDFINGLSDALDFFLGETLVMFTVAVIVAFNGFRFIIKLFLFIILVKIFRAAKFALDS